MDTSPVSPDDIRAAAEVHEELGPQYRDDVVAAFVDRVEREVDARVAARLATMPRADVAPLRRETLLKGLVLGAGAGALVALAAAGLGGAHPAVHFPHFRSHLPPGTIQLLPVIRSKSGPGFPPPAVRRITVPPPKA